MNPAQANWRMWIPSTAMMLCTLLAYIDRLTLSSLSTTILADTGLNQEQYGWAVFAFSITYMATNPVWGSIVDYIGLRQGMLMAVAVWTVASAAHAWVGGLLGFMIARAVLGAGEGAAFPGALRTAAEALPVEF